MNVIKQIKWFNKNSKDYMSGHSNWHYWTHYLKALIKFLWFSRKG